MTRRFKREENISVDVGRKNIKSVLLVNKLSGENIFLHFELVEFP